MKDNSADLAFFGGSFNPVHRGHYALVSHILHKKLTKRVLISCTYQNPFKRALYTDGDILALASDRLNMLKLAFKDMAQIEIYEEEVKAKVVNYTIHTVEKIVQERFLEQNGTEVGGKNFHKSKLALIVGSDVLDTIWQWKRAKDLSDLVTLIVYPRQKYPCHIQNNVINSPCQTYGFNCVYLDDGPLYNMSASQVREDFRTKKRSDDVLPSVCKYIQKHNIYGLAQ